MRFIGLDLSWANQNSSGVAIIDITKGFGEVTCVEYLTDHGKVSQWMGQNSTSQCVVAIDAPLIAVNPKKTQRAVEREVSSLFWKYNAPCHSSNCDRAKQTILFSQEINLPHLIPVVPQANCKGQIEVYPHIIQAGLLRPGQKIIQYKKGSKDDKRDKLIQYKTLLFQRLLELEPRVEMNEDVLGFLQILENHSGAALKKIEDQLDAIACAYMGFYYWWWGEEKCSVFGDLDNGYIVGPKPPFQDHLKPLTLRQAQGERFIKLNDFKIATGGTLE